MKNTFELMQQLLVNAGRSTGTTIISAAAGTPFALEDGDLQNSIIVSELKRMVGQRVEELTKGLQKPTSRNETNNFDWEIW